MGLAGSHVEDILNAMDMAYVLEAFADRQYEADGKLRSRSLPNAIINNATTAAQQVVSIAENGETQSIDGQKVLLDAKSFCIHGDNPAAVDILREIDALLTAHNIEKKHF